MTLVLYHHPLASFCHKVLIALYENGTPFEHRIVNLGDEESRSDLFRFWPIGKIPLLRDEAMDSTVPETTIMIEYIDRHYQGALRLLPEDVDGALRVRLWDRFFDCYVQTPMQKIVADKMRADGQKDPVGTEEAYVMLRTAYDMAEKQLGQKNWIAGDSFTMADCSAAPALFYAETLEPFGENRPALTAYYNRLLERPSFARVLEEARPYFQFYPYKDRLPERFRSTDQA